MNKTILAILVIIIAVGVYILFLSDDTQTQEQLNDTESQIVYCDADGNRYTTEAQATAAGLTEAQYGATFCPEYVAAQTGDYTGVPIKQATEIAEARGEMFRVVEIDGEIQPATRDFQQGRINASVSDGVVTSYTVEGSESVSDSQPAEGTAGSQTNPMFQDSTLEGDIIEPESSSDTAAGNEHDAIIGTSVAEAEAYAEANDVDFRTGTIDGQPMPVTLDYRPGRITAEIENNVVVGYTVEWE